MSETGHRNRWTKEEIHYLREYAHQRTIDQIIKKFKYRHTEKSIWKKCRSLGLSRAANNDGYTAEELRQGLGVNQRRIYRWVEYGWLEGTRRGPGDTAWNFSDDAIRHFLLHHSDQLSQKILNSLWVRDLMHSRRGFGSLIDFKVGRSSIEKDISKKAVHRESEQ